MKKIITILALISVSLIYAQDSEPTKWSFRWGYSSTLRQFQPDSCKQNKIVTGFQWNSTNKMNNAVYNNAFANHGYQKVDSATRRYPLLMIDQPTWHDNAGYNIGAWNAPFMQYEPNLLITNSNKGKIQRTLDPSKCDISIFWHLHIVAT